MTQAGPTFACPSCGAPISGPPGHVFACPFCRSNVVAPGVPMGPAGPSGPFTTSTDGLALGYEPGVGFALVGPHMPPGDKPRIRAWDFYNKKLAWDGLLGESWISDDTATAVCGRSVYVTDHRTLVALDLMTGARKWTVDLPAKVARFQFGERALRIYDRASLFVATEDGSLSAFDRDTGAARATRRYHRPDPYWGESGPLVRGETVLVAHDAKIADVMGPGGETLARIQDTNADARIERCDVDGDHAILQVASWGERGERGVVIVDLRDPRPQFFAMPSPFLKCNSVCIDGRAYVATDIGMKLRTRGNVAASPPIAGYQFMALVRAGGSLVALLWNSDVEPYVRRLVWLDPMTLTERFEGSDLGSIGGDAGDWWMHHVETDGRIVTAVASPEDDVSRCEIRAFDASHGRLLWTRPIGEWRRHYVAGGYVVVRTTTSIAVLRPDNGEPIAVTAD